MEKFVIEVEVHTEENLPTPDVTAFINAWVTLPSGRKAHGQVFAERGVNEPYTREDVLAAIADALHPSSEWDPSEHLEVEGA